MDCVKKGTTFGNRTTLPVTPPPIEEGEDEEENEEDEFSDNSGSEVSSWGLTTYSQSDKIIYLAQLVQLAGTTSSAS